MVMANAGLEIYDSKGNKIYNTVNYKSYYKIGSFYVGNSLYPNGTSEGHGPIITVLSDSGIKPNEIILNKLESVPLIGYSYGHYPAHEADGDGYINIVVNEGYITAQFRRIPAYGTKGQYFIYFGGQYEVWGLKK